MKKISFSVKIILLLLLACSLHLPLSYGAAAPAGNKSESTAVATMHFGKKAKKLEARKARLVDRLQRKLKQKHKKTPNTNINLWAAVAMTIAITCGLLAILFGVLLLLGGSLLLFSLLGGFFLALSIVFWVMAKDAMNNV